MLKDLKPEQVQEFLKLNQRRLVLTNQTAQTIEALVVYRTPQGQEAKDTLKLDGGQIGKIPFFVDGVCSVTVEGKTIDIPMNTPLVEHQCVIGYEGMA